MNRSISASAPRANLLLLLMLHLLRADDTCSSDPSNCNSEAGDGSSLATDALTPGRSGPSLFRWDPVAVGHLRKLLIGGRILEMRTLSLRPVLFEVSDFLIAEEAEDLLHSAVKVSLNQTAVESATEPANSIVKRFEHGGSALARNISWRMAALARFPLENVRRTRQDIEVVLVSNSTCDQHAARPTLVHDGAKDMNQFVTILHALNTPERGGELCFPRGARATNVSDTDADNSAAAKQANSQTCFGGLSVKLQTGKTYLWYNYNISADGELGAADRSATYYTNCVQKGELATAKTRIWIPPWNSIYGVPMPSDHVGFFLRKAIARPGDAVFLFMHDKSQMQLLADVNVFAEKKLAGYEALGELSPLHFVSVDMSEDLHFLDKCFEVVGVRTSIARPAIGALPAVCLIVLAEDYDPQELAEMQFIPDQVSTRYVGQAKGRDFDLGDVQRLVDLWQAGNLDASDLLPSTEAHFWSVSVQILIFMLLAAAASVFAGKRTQQQKYYFVAWLLVVSGVFFHSFFVADIIW